MLTKEINIAKFSDMLTDSELQYKSYSNFNKIIEPMYMSRKVMLGLINSPKDTVYENLKKKLASRIFPIYLSGVDFFDKDLFEKFPESLQNRTNVVIFFDAIVGNSVYLFRSLDKKYHEELLYEFSTFSVLIQYNILINLFNKIYGSTELSHEKQDLIAIAIAFSLFHNIYGNQMDVAKLKTINFLDKVYLLKMKKHQSRVGINVSLDSILVNATDVNNILDLLYGAGAFQDFMNIKELFSAIQSRFGKDFIKYFFSTIKFNDKRMQQDYYLYKMIILANSDILFTQKGYRIIHKNMSKYTRTISSVTKRIIDRMGEILGKGV